jgi:hypothetical protein
MNCRLVGAEVAPRGRGVQAQRSVPEHCESVAEHRLTEPRSAPRALSRCLLWGPPDLAWNTELHPGPGPARQTKARSRALTDRAEELHRDEMWRAMTTIDDRGVAPYHVVLRHEGFEESARAFFRLIRRAQEMKPGGRRMPFLDIEGHRAGDGRFDADMYELQHDLLLGVLGPFLTEARCPLMTFRNPHPPGRRPPRGRDHRAAPAAAIVAGHSESVR